MISCQVFMEKPESFTLNFQRNHSMAHGFAGQLVKQLNQAAGLALP
jgi:hypothetical protein